MFYFLKEKILNFLYGEKFEVTISEARELIDVKKALSSFPSSSLSLTVITGDSATSAMLQLQPQQRWADNETSKKGIENCVIPDIVLQFFQKGGTLEEVDNYTAILEYGMLHGKKRRLVIL